MKRNPKRTMMAWLLTAAMLLSLLPTVALAADTVDSGTCGDDLTWALDEDGVLTISGTGDMTNYDWMFDYTDYTDKSSAPWSDSCKSITSIVIGDSVTSIGRYAFAYCTSLASVTIPDSVTSIGGEAFYDCTGLISVTIGSGVTSIGYRPFGYCRSLTEIQVSEGSTAYCSVDGVLFSKDMTELICYPAGKTDTSYNIPDNVTSIGDSAFIRCTGLTSVTIPDSATNIGDYAFFYCTGLTSVTIGSGVTSIGSYAFEDCTGLTSVTIPDNVTSIGSYAFHTTGLIEITIGSGVTNIEKYAFSNTAFYRDENNWEDNVLYLGDCLLEADADSLEGSYAIKEGTTTIADSAFEDCTGLTSVTIPDSVASIGDDAFEYCTGLTSATIGSGVTSIGSSAFYWTGLTSVYISDLAAWCNIAFSDGSSNPLYAAEEIYLDGELITDLIIPDGVTNIGNWAFYYCNSLTSVTIPDSVTSIGSSAFAYCTGLTSVIIPDSVTSIGRVAFSGCTGLTSVTIGSGVTSIGSSAFYNCIGLTSVIIGNGVTSIGSSAFEYCTSLTSVTIPDSVTSIGNYAFSDCYNLTSVSLGSGVTSIGNGAFYDCTGLTSVTIGSGVTSIGSYAFYYCTDLTSVTIPDSVTSIGSYAFEGCTGLTDVYYSGSEGEWNDISIGSNNENLTSATVHYNSTGPDEEDTHTHSYTATVTKAATCTTAGVRTYTCSCGASYTETIPATGHSWNSGEVTTPATRYTEGEKTYTCTVCGATRTETIAVLTGSAAQFLFTDVTNTAASYYTPVYWAYDYGITKGTSVTAFSPSATCTRAQFVTFLWRLAGEPEPASSNNPFTDVTNTSASYYKAVLWAVEQGVTKGTSATTFSPSQTITRAQAVTFLYRYAGEPAVSASSSFTDVTNTSASYYKAVIWAVEKGITNGTTSTTFSPSNPCTRGQMVTFLYRYAVEPLTT